MTMTAADAASTLTRREREVLAHLAAGRNRPEIGAALGVAESTIRTLTIRLYRRLGATNAAHAVHLAWQLGLLGTRGVPNKPPEVPDVRYLVWSHEAHAWWKPGGFGCTADVNLAGRYTAAQAREACGLRSWRSPACPPEVHVRAPECWPNQYTGAQAAAYMGLLIRQATAQAIADRSAASRGQAVAS